MADDLVATPGQVHDRAREVLRFWFEETPAEKRFAKDAALDADIAARFTAMRDDVLADGARGWADRPGDLLAAVILLDQFSRNMHRGTAQAFAGDALARSLVHTAIARQWPPQFSDDERQFLFMPLMHSEVVTDQAVSLAVFAELANGEWLDYAQQHHAVVERFGRFPSRNAALGRVSTPEEADYLSQPDAGW